MTRVLCVKHMLELDVELSFESCCVVATIVHDLGETSQEQSAEPGILGEQIRTAQHIKQKDRPALETNLDQRDTPRRPQVPFQIDGHGLSLHDALVDRRECSLGFCETVDQHVSCWESRVPCLPATMPYLVKAYSTMVDALAANDLLENAAEASGFPPDSRIEVKRKHTDDAAGNCRSILGSCS